jgi:glycosyltransferase involved in cell wall biosynthesis
MMVSLTSEVLQIAEDKSFRRIRVLHLGSPTGLYGAERWILALAKHLPSSRVESWVAAIIDAPGLKAPLCQQAMQGGFRTCLFEAYGRLSLSAVGQLRRFIVDNKIDVLHTHGYKTDILGCLAARGTFCKTLATPHGWGAAAGAKLRLYEVLDRMFFYFIDAIVPLSTQLYVGLCRWPGLRGRLHLIPNAVDLSEVDNAGDPPTLLGAWRAEGDIVVGYIGRLDRGKRIDTLIRAFHRLQHGHKRLCIVGEGPERHKLEQLATELGLSDEVVFFGFREDRLALLRGFDLFVMPSEREGTPRCLMEAMAAGLGVIASDIPGCRELVSHEETGCLFATGDIVALVKHMQRLISDSALRARLAEAGKRHVREAYSAEVMAGRYLALYEQLVNCDARRMSRDST